MTRTDYPELTEAEYQYALFRRGKGAKIPKATRELVISAFTLFHTSTLNNVIEQKKTREELVKHIASLHKSIRYNLEIFTEGTEEL